DSDDYVENNHVLLMTECAENEQADIVLTDYYIDLSGKQELVHQKPISLDKKRLICDALEARHHAGLWCKIFRREVIARNAIPPAPYSYYEDMFSYFSFLQYATNIVYSPCATYHYRYNQQSMTNSIDVPMRISTYEQCMKNLEELVRICKFSDDEEIMKALYDRVNGEKIRLFIFCSQHYQFLKSSLMSYFPQSFTTLQPHTINERIVYLTIKGKVIFQHLYMLWYRLCRKLLLKQKI
ncbi:MAG: hypothetical protein IKO63_04330, partial [Paludibacteraceae bacterium]|nr:hypothetical protein [Paludibacteraceae bacterium]